MYKCEIIADSLNPQGDRLTTYKVTYPRIIHAEFLRHRMLSRNVASSRAIPFKKMVKDVMENPFIPIAWQKNHKGMQGNEYITNQKVVDFKKGVWLNARNEAIKHAEELYGDLWKQYSATSGELFPDTGVTKQLCNRLLEPFVWTTELISGTEWDNFFELRCPKYTLLNHSVSGREQKVYKSKQDAEIAFGSELNQCAYELGFHSDDPMFWLSINKSQAEIHIQKIAEMMWDAYKESIPKQLEAGQWHIPFGDKINLDSRGTVHPSDEAYGFTLRTWYAAKGIDLPDIKIATARCARLSYETLGDNPKVDYEADIKLHDRLLGSKHMSPFEHCARAISNDQYESFRKTVYTGDMQKEYSEFGWCNNFKGFIQYRHLIE